MPVFFRALIGKKVLNEDHALGDRKRRHREHASLKILLEPDIRPRRPRIAIGLRIGVCDRNRLIPVGFTPLDKPRCLLIEIDRGKARDRRPVRALEQRAQCQLLLIDARGVSPSTVVRQRKRRKHGRLSNDIATRRVQSITLQRVGADCDGSAVFPAGFRRNDVQQPMHGV